MTTTKAMRLASLVTAINVLVASGFSIAAIIRPQYLVPAASGGRCKRRSPGHFLRATVDMAQANPRARLQALRLATADRDLTE